ncbi:MAG: tetratricopeptide repeat protein [Legionellales bacterium]|nr:tetratricopeptide repeat protein [Legionellales bacterium]
MNWLILILSATLATTGHAMTWRDWWETRDQQAQTFMHAGDYAQAEQLFQRPDWRATAAYRAEHYQQAAQTYGALQTADGYYNAGNALAKMGQYQPAIAAYNQALQRDAQHHDALFNRQIVQKLLDKQKEQQKQQSDKQKSDKQESDKQESEKKQQPSSDASKKSDPKQSKSEQDKQKKPQDATDQPSKPKPEPTQPAPEPEKADQADKAAQKKPGNRSEREAQQAKEQWLRLIPDDPAYLLREKFLRDHLNRQNGEVGS